MERTLRERLLDAREARQARIDRLCAEDGTLLALSTNVPGGEKFPPGLGALVDAACAALAARLPATPIQAGRDELGPWACFRAALTGEEAKRAAIRIEEELPGGRLLDLDVYAAGGRQVDRASLGLPPRQCLVCDQPAVDCIRLRRHPPDDVEAATARLLHLRPSGFGGRARLAACLVEGARVELDLTPKPGLVDRLDNGSHPDLSFEAMARSIGLLPVYFDELVALTEPFDLPGCIAAGQRAERRMFDAIGANAHKGYIFLAGLVLLAAGASSGLDEIRANLPAVARRVLDILAQQERTAPAPSHGARARSGHGVGGVLREAMEGLPSVFVHGLPVLAPAACRPASPGAAKASQATGHLLMAVLMQAVEDTTAIHRCGPAGLTRLREDGRLLQRLIERGQDYVPWLVSLNEDYRRLNLTMGGVADCMALCFSLHSWVR